MRHANDQLLAELLARSTFACARSAALTEAAAAACVSSRAATSVSRAARRRREACWGELAAPWRTQGGVVVVCLHCDRIKVAPDRWAVPPRGAVGTIQHAHDTLEMSHGICQTCLMSVYHLQAT